jgi:thiamine-monophosphate kinase
MTALEFPLGPGGEFDLIRAIAERLGARGAHLGDDCALIPAGEDTLVLSTDMSIEGVHFQRAWLSPEEIGWRAAMGALSDLGAAGAACVGLLAALAGPRTDPPGQLVALMEGVGGAVDSVGGVVLGGDLAAAPLWTLAITVVGRTRRPMSRRGARPGDGIWVTGSLGGARAALAAWQAGRIPLESLRTAFARPRARIAAGQWLAAAGAHAMMDLSDGLAGDAHHLANASGVALELTLDRLPVADGVAGEAERQGRSPAEFAAEGGEDYELLVALPPEFGTAESDRFQAACGLPLTRLGGVSEGRGVTMRLGAQVVTPSGFDHFR